MPEGGVRIRPASVLTLVEVRRLVRAPAVRGAAIFFGLAYTLGALVSGSMLLFANLGPGYSAEILLGTPGQPQWWNYPGLIVYAPWGVLQLPLFSTIVMVVVAVGVALGMGVAAALTYRLVRPSREEQARNRAVGVATGLTPAMLSLVTLGACCSTTAAATAGIGLVADASATTVSNLLLNDWYLGVFQMVVVWVSLFAQELLLTVYGGLVGRTEPGRCPAPAPRAGPWLGIGALRVVLLSGGLLAVLGVLVAWTTVGPLDASAARWVAWIVQGGVVGVAAVLLSLLPLGTVRRIGPWRTGRLPRPVPAVLAAGGASLLVWYPPQLVAQGFVGAPNLVASSGASLAEVPVLLFRLVVELIVPGVVLLAAAARSRGVERFLGRGSEAGVAPSPGPTGPVGAAPEPAGPFARASAGAVEPDGR